MPHTLILGMTESGKTTLGKRLSGGYGAHRIPRIVLDPLCDPGWQADYQTSAPEDFLSVLWRSQSCAVFIDEAGDSVGRYDVAMQQCATRARHWGHNVHFLCQRATQVAVIVRDQCSHLFLFRVSAKDADILAAEWSAPDLAMASSLERGEFIHVSRFGACERGRVFNGAARVVSRSVHDENGTAPPRSASTSGGRRSALAPAPGAAEPSATDAAAPAAA